MTMLYSNTKLTLEAKKSVAQLNARESVWNERQHELQAENDAKKTQKACGVQAYQRRVLQNCKKWGGPCVNSEDLE